MPPRFLNAAPNPLNLSSVSSLSQLNTILCGDFLFSEDVAHITQLGTYWPDWVNYCARFYLGKY